MSSGRRRRHVPAAPGAALAAALLPCLVLAAAISVLAPGLRGAAARTAPPPAQTRPPAPAKPPAQARPAPPAPPTAEILVRQFARLAFDSEFGGAHRRGHLVRWEGPIRVSVRGFDSARYIGEVRRRLVWLARLTGRDIRLLDWSSALGGANLEIVFDSAGGSRLERSAPCSTLLFDRHFVVYRAVIRIAPSDPAQRRHCLTEELIQALGLANDSELIARSIFSDGHQSAQPYWWDTLMLRLLYDPAVTAGMSWYEARPIITRLVARLTGSR